MNSIKNLLRSHVRGIVKKPVKPNILMLHLGRCGSTVIGGILDRHPSIDWRKEMLHSFWKSVPMDIGESETRKRLRKECESLAQRKSPSKRNGHWVGGEVKLWELEMAGLSVPWCIENILSKNGRVVLLKRNNLVRKLVSALRAQSGVAPYAQVVSADRLVKKGRVELRSPKIRFSIGSFLEVLRAYQVLQKKAEADVRDCGGLVLSYEGDVLMNPLEGVESIFEFLNLEMVSGVKPSLQKVNPGSLADLVSNFDELEDHLKHTEFEDSLYQP